MRVRSAICLFSINSFSNPRCLPSELAFQHFYIIVRHNRIVCKRRTHQNHSSRTRPLQANINAHPTPTPGERHLLSIVKSSIYPHTFVTLGLPSSYTFRVISSRTLFLFKTLYDTCLAVLFCAFSKSIKKTLTIVVFFFGCIHVLIQDMDVSEKGHDYSKIHNRFDKFKILASFFPQTNTRLFFVSFSSNF